MTKEQIYNCLCKVLTDYETVHKDPLQLYSDIVNLVNDMWDAEWC